MNHVSDCLSKFSSKQRFRITVPSIDELETCIAFIARFLPFGSLDVLRITLLETVQQRSLLRNVEMTLDVLRGRRIFYEPRRACQSADNNTG